MSLAEKLHPSRFSDMSGKMAAIVGYIISEKFTDPEITDMCILSDGGVLAQMEGDVGLNHFIAAATDLQRNWDNLLLAADLTVEEKMEAENLFNSKISDFRMGGIQL